MASRLICGSSDYIALNYRLLDRMGKEIIAAYVEVQWNVHAYD